MATDPLPIGQDMLRQALGHMQSALELLDRSDVSAHIGAHLDLAVCELQGAIAMAPQIVEQQAATNRPS